MRVAAADAWATAAYPTRGRPAVGQWVATLMCKGSCRRGWRVMPVWRPIYAAPAAPRTSVVWVAWYPVRPQGVALERRPGTLRYRDVDVDLVGVDDPHQDRVVVFERQGVQPECGRMVTGRR